MTTNSPALVLVGDSSAPVPESPPAADTRPLRRETDQPLSSLGHLLVEGHLITPEQLEAALERQERSPRRLGQILVDMGTTTPDAVLGVLSLQLGIPSTRVNAHTLNAKAVRYLPEKVARKHRVMPLMKIGRTLVVAIGGPVNLSVFDDLRFASGCHIQIVVGLEDEIQSALDRYYCDNWLGEETSEGNGEVVIEAPPQEEEPAEDEAAERSAVRVIERILNQGVGDGASDIHLEPTADSFRARLRVDGVLREVGYLSPNLGPALLSRVKVLGGLDITERRLPQDGRFGATVGARRVDVRLSTFPTIYGEKAVLRILDRSALRLELAALGMGGPMLETFRDLIHRPEGMVLVTGPTGSGKTSTLYAALTHIAETGKHIISIEDPVEYAVSGVNQGQTNEKAGFTFARGLRAILRQDPDVIMVGEIRDTETLSTAIEASLTGHLVFSTLHTNSAVGTITRLLEMKLEPYLIATCLLGVVAQRLVRRICRTCRREMAMPSGMGRLFPREVPAVLYRGAGCPDCRGTGYRGRVGLFELVPLTEELRQLVIEGASEAEFARVTAQRGLPTLRDECLALVAEGLTTLEEVVRLTQDR